MIQPAGILVALFMLTTFTPSVSAEMSSAQGPALKTSHKRYMVYPYQGQTILCEPYTVAKNDWLYKIFRKKGEISDKDFPLFLLIFQNLNPPVSNIDAISPGQQIMIPLKRIDGDYYKQTEPGVIDVPVLEFSSMPKRLDPYLTRRDVNEGDVVSRLIDKSFINPDGSLNSKGMLAFKLANPTIENPDLIYAGTTINIPASAIISQPWFQALLRENSLKQEQPGIPNEPDSLEATDPVARNLAAAYTATLGGELMNIGKLYIPLDDGPDMTLDLETTPVIRKPDGSKILLVAQNRKDPILIKALQSFWPRLTLMDLKILEKQFSEKAGDGLQKTADDSEYHVLEPTHEAAVSQLLNLAAFNYTREFPLTFSLGGIELEVIVGRVSRMGKPDLIINFGSVYGTEALEAIRQKGLEIVSIPPRETMLEAIATVFKALGVTVTSDPTFINPENETPVIIPGIYITGIDTTLFITGKPLTRQSADFLKNNNVRILYTLPPSTQGA